MHKTIFFKNTQLSLSEQDIRKPLIIWLIICCLSIAIMVFIGGMTRLTDSGLSMTTWKPVTGIIPPLSEQEWLNHFELYKQSPEFKKINFDFTLHEFKEIFWWEYIHRLWGRIIGLIFFLPYLYFLIRKRIPQGFQKHFLTALLLGGSQGLIGWWMVKSGLHVKPDVSHYRLAIHLGMAFIIYGYLLILILKLLDKKTFFIQRRSKIWLYLIGFTLLPTIIYGAFTAGLKGGLIYNSFPTMDGEWMPNDVLYLKPIIQNFFENVAAIQWTHRLLATLTVIFTCFFFIFTFKKYPEHWIKVSCLFFAIFTQYTLGILTILTQVMVLPAISHQMVALMVITFYLWCFYRMRSYG